ncbi:MAG TPA: LysE family transporter [Ferruginibacter sp.]|nr:LysE family transporter [Ferruginibacter sp.]HRO18500.1 LysE family transporter [Ferruginibacter sp.]HRQ21586.1 LysE family transporter [Ferruginibacter sp.]
MLIRVFFWGMLISFLGSLPMGTLNVTAMQISIQETVSRALMFSCGVLLIEMIYVRLSLIAIDWIRKQVKWMQAMQWVTLLIVVALAVGSFMAAANSDPQAKNVVLENNLNRFLLGMMMSAVNPVQIPFWFGWSTILFTKGVLSPRVKVLNAYIVGVGLGTFTSHLIFIYGGKIAAGSIHNSDAYLNWIIGGVFSLTACIHLFKILRGKNAFKKLEEDGS